MHSAGQSPCGWYPNMSFCESYNVVSGHVSHAIHIDGYHLVLAASAHRVRNRLIRFDARHGRVDGLPRYVGRYSAATTVIAITSVWKETKKGGMTSRAIMTCCGRYVRNTPLAACAVVSSAVVVTSFSSVPSSTSFDDDVFAENPASLYTAF